MPTEATTAEELLQEHAAASLQTFALAHRGEGLRPAWVEHLGIASFPTAAAMNASKLLAGQWVPAFADTILAVLLPHGRVRRQYVALLTGITIQDCLTRPGAWIVQVLAGVRRGSLPEIEPERLEALLRADPEVLPGMRVHTPRGIGIALVVRGERLRVILDVDGEADASTVPLWWFQAADCAVVA